MKEAIYVHALANQYCTCSSSILYTDGRNETPTNQLQYASVYI